MMMNYLKMLENIKKYLFSYFIQKEIWKCFQYLYVFIK